MKDLVGIAADHGGFALKANLLSCIKSEGFELKDFGALSYEAFDDYPDFAEVLARAVAAGKVWRGIIICGSGIGACIAANKILGVRAGLCHDTYSAHQGVEHDDMNILCLGARVIGEELAKELVRTFLAAEYSLKEHHQRRLNKIKAIEAKVSKQQ